MPQGNRGWRRIRKALGPAGEGFQRFLAPGPGSEGSSRSRSRDRRMGPPEASRKICGTRFLKRVTRLTDGVSEGGSQDRRTEAREVGRLTSRRKVPAAGRKTCQRASILWSPPRKVTNSPREARGARFTGIRELYRLRETAAWCGPGVSGKPGTRHSGGSAQEGHGTDPFGIAVHESSFGRPDAANRKVQRRWRTGRWEAGGLTPGGLSAAEPSGIDRGPLGPRPDPDRGAGSPHEGTVNGSIGRFGQRRSASRLLPAREVAENCG